jgi:threonine dehydratase
MPDLTTLHDLQQARQRIAPAIYRTPLIPFYAAGERGEVYLKPENLQPIGSFKLRGAYNRLAALREGANRAGTVVAYSAVVAYSSGNHAQGVAYAARALGLQAAIVMPLNAPKIKINATRALGAEVITYNPATESREQIAVELAEARAAVLVPPFNDPHVIAGQGTIGLEIADDLPDVDLVLVPIGGGGLISGVATAIKLCAPHAKVIGVEPELAADAQASFRGGSIVSLTPAETARTIADGVRTLALGDLTFAHMQRYVDDVVTVREAEIREAVRRLALDAKQVIEPSGVLPVAALLHHRDELPPARRIVCVLSGGSIDPTLLAAILGEG